MKKLVSVLVALAASLLTGDEVYSAFVIKVEDGDTLRLSVTGGVEAVRCRLAGIDAPEKGQSFAEVARARLTELVEKKNVTFTDVGPDKYRRRLGRITLEDGTDVNLEMVREGYAWHLSHFLTNETYKAVQKEAREARRGLWIEDKPIEPRIYRKGNSTRRR